MLQVNRRRAFPRPGKMRVFLERRERRFHRSIGALPFAPEALRGRDVLLGEAMDINARRLERVKGIEPPRAQARNLNGADA